MKLARRCVAVCLCARTWHIRAQVQQWSRYASIPIHVCAPTCLSTSTGVAQLPGRNRLAFILPLLFLPDSSAQHINSVENRWRRHLRHKKINKLKKKIFLSHSCATSTTTTLVQSFFCFSCLGAMMSHSDMSVLIITGHCWSCDLKCLVVTAAPLNALIAGLELRQCDWAGMQHTTCVIFELN